MSKHPNAEKYFIIVNEAYEFLSDERRRENLKSRRRTISQAELLRREKIYKQWQQKSQEEAQKRAYRHAHDSFDEFMNSRIYKAAMKVSAIYNYIFVGIGIIMALGPFVGMLFREESAHEVQAPLWTAIFPFILGIAFLYGIYYFQFKFDPEE